MSHSSKDHVSAYNAAYYAANKARISARHSARRAEYPPDYASIYAANAEAIKAHVAAWRSGHKNHIRSRDATYGKNLKMEALVHYGGAKCVCCGETLFEGLTLDHINGNGAEQRGQHGSGVPLYSWLKRQDYPGEIELQVLCGTCNLAKRRLAHCPHQRAPKHEIDPHRESIRRTKLAALNAYGGAKCVCCGETLLEGLTLDHVNGHGREQRKKHGSGYVMYLWLQKNHWPPGFRVLCATCNMAKRTNDYCPHEDAFIAWG